jgi:predicted nucleotidyltransferase
MKEHAEKALNELYQKHKHEGILSMYLWGSILTDDFKQRSSDIDSIAVVEDSFPIEKEQEMINFVRNSNPDMKEFFIRVLYVSELNGENPKAPLASVIDPRLLLLEMPNWDCVVGKNLTNQDFTLKPPSFAEAIKIHLAQIKEKGWDKVSLILHDKHMYFIKTLCRIVDLLQKERGDQSPFSYSKIARVAGVSGSNLEKETIATILEVRRNNWDYQTFLTNELIFQKFLDSLKISENQD